MSVRLQIFSPVRLPLAVPLRRLLRLLGIRRGAWTITVVGDAEMAALHGRTMGLPSTTDVLTFDMRDDTEEVRSSKFKIKNRKLATESVLDLDTVICLDEARRRAGELGHGVEREVLLYALHSLLHVQGYDDRTPRAFARMHAREDELLRAIGVGAVYRPEQGPEKGNRIPARREKIENRRSAARRAS